MIEGALRTILINDSAVSNLVGSRIYPLRATQDVEFPAIVYRRISTTGRDLTHSGPVTSATARFQFDCFSDSALQAKQLATAVLRALQDYSGTVIGETIMRAQCVNEADAVDLDLGFFVPIDFEILYRETY